MRIVFLGAKVSVFSKIKTTITVSHPKGLTWHKSKNKNTSNQRLDELFIEKQNQKNKNKDKIGLPPNKHYCLTPLARRKARVDLSVIIFGMQSISGSHNRFIRQLIFFPGKCYMPFLNGN